MVATLAEVTRGRDVGWWRRWPKSPGKEKGEADRKKSAYPSRPQTPMIASASSRWTRGQMRLRISSTSLR